MLAKKVCKVSDLYGPCSYLLLFLIMEFYSMPEWHKHCHCYMSAFVGSSKYRTWMEVFFKIVRTKWR